MGSITYIKPLLSTALSSSSTVNLTGQHQTFWERQESNLGPLGAKREHYPLCYAGPPRSVKFKWSSREQVCKFVFFDVLTFFCFTLRRFNGDAFFSDVSTPSVTTLTTTTSFFVVDRIWVSFRLLSPTSPASLAFCCTWKKLSSTRIATLPKFALLLFTAALPNELLFMFFVTTSSSY